MKAIVFGAKNNVQFTDLPDPQAGAGEVVIQVKASGICHTDFEVLKDNYGTGAFPVVPGHEYAGVVVEVGAGVNTVTVGDRVAVDPNLECGTCRACGRGWAHLCENLGAYGVTTHGGFAELSVVKASAVHPIGKMSYLQAALAEPMGCVLNGIDAVHAPWMEEALIFGAGPMGLLMGMALKAEGVANVVFVDISENRLELASSFGFDAIAAGSDALQGWHHRADLVVEATGLQAVASGLTNYMANGGKGLFFGVCPSDAQIDVAPFEVFRRQLTLAGSHSLNHNIPRSLDVIAGLAPDIDRLVSHRLQLDEISQILSTKPPSDSLKVQWTNE
ncbi:alcohol dehydrogenase catalytic domain-containing protein [Sulfitobacter donghicola]|uniref:Zinc-binding dehydrogenase n=1 Tax=Sulfitobacter donghicola DSW-25 = KCTC 12864 = JCM 14565 TaxID=1300350 RepID=A0A073IGR3_9RHOB|nr:alcohol dehydrogenase catalytic domain-containing protein [Sulfitobacter donghicola]KEJ88701.1 zinc-binding dehydrogenase [Sulfitobacter donghicola DSW-25 = KCTC 12864 = JCM 14565]KIN68475.1 Alcohol dehydrogenase GroES domain protein [Sulfitobacter donghicola DSW-25 = KCTC 12864 = JCM 14565]